MKQPFKHLLFIIVFTISAVTTAQQTNQGKVIISESELTSLIETILKHKNGLNKESDSVVVVKKTVIVLQDTLTNVKHQLVSEQPIKKITTTKTEVKSTNTEPTVLTNATSKTKQPITSLKEEKIATTATNTVSNEELKKLSFEIQELKKQLTDYLATTKAASKNEVKPSVIKEKQVIVSPPVITTQYRDSIVLIRDTVYITNNLINYIDTTSVNTNLLAAKIIALQNRLIKKDSIIATLYNKKSSTVNTTTKETNLKESKLVYFANNVSEIYKDQEVAISKIADILKNNNVLTVHLKGFASNTGNENYNKILSNKRIASVKTLFIKQGVDEAKISSENVGIDYNTTDESKARRVEIEIK